MDSAKNSGQRCAMCEEYVSQNDSVFLVACVSSLMITCIPCANFQLNPCFSTCAVKRLPPCAIQGLLLTNGYFQ